jgi:hypothetical protein
MMISSPDYILLACGIDIARDLPIYVILSEAKNLTRVTFGCSVILSEAKNPLDCRFSLRPASRAMLCVSQLCPRSPRGVTFCREKVTKAR